MSTEPDLASWANLARTVDSFKSSSGDGCSTVEVALVGKYVGLEDAYLSVVKALTHASMHLNVHIKVMIRLFLNIILCILLYGGTHEISLSWCVFRLTMLSIPVHGYFALCCVLVLFRFTSV